MHREQYESPNGQWDITEILDREISRIPEKLRSPLILCYLDGKTPKEAALKLEISIDALNQRLHRGRELLKKRLGRYGMEWNLAMLMAQMVEGVQIPEVPTELVERTLDMVKIMTLSNGALNSAGISPHVAALVKGAMGAWTLKMKLCLSIVLLSLAGVGAGIATYPAFLLNHMGCEPLRQSKSGPSDKLPDEPQTDNLSPRTDCYGDPLPPGALARLGTLRFRNDGERLYESLVVTPGKVNPLIVNGRSGVGGPRLWDFTTGRPLFHFQDSRGKAISVDRTREASWAISFDGRLLAKCENPGAEFHFWDMSTYKLLNLRMKEYPEFLSISSDGKTVAAMCGHFLRCWDTTTGRQRWECNRENYSYSHLVSSTDGKTWMALARRRGQPEKNINIFVCRWDAATGKKLAPWDIADDVANFAWSRNGGTLAVRLGWKEKIIHLWNMDTGKKVRQICVEGKISPALPHIRLALSPDGKILATGAYYQDEKGKVCLWDTATGQRLRDCSSHDNMPECLAFSCDGKSLVSKVGGDNHIMLIYEVASGKPVNQEWFARGYCTEVGSLAFSSPGDTLVSTTRFETQIRLDVWDTTATAGRNVPRSVIPGLDPVGREHLSVALSPDGKFAASTVRGYEKETDSSFTVVRLWEVATGKELAHDRVARGWGLVSFSPNGKFLACSPGEINGGYRTVVWEVATGTRLAGEMIGRAMAFFPDGKILITRAEEGLYLWKTVTGKKLYHLPKSGRDEFRDVAVSPDGQILATFGFVQDEASKKSYGQIYLWRVHASNQSVRLEGPRLLLPKFATSGSRLSFSPDRRLLAVNDFKTPVIHVWEIATGQERFCFNDGRTNSRPSLCPPSFSPDGRRLASAHKDTTILLWDLTGRLNGERLRQARLSLQQLEARWVDLGSPDAARAARALWSLVAAGLTSVSFLERRLPPIQWTWVPAETITRLIADLDRNAFAVRKKAREELKSLGETAEASLRQALNNDPSPELRRNIEGLLTTIEQARDILLPSSPEVLRSLRAIEVLEQIGTSEAQQLLKVLSRGVPGVRQTLEAQAALGRMQQHATSRP